MSEQPGERHHRFTTDTFIEIPDPDDQFGMPIFSGPVKNAYAILENGNYSGQAFFDSRPEDDEEYDPVDIHVVITPDGIWCAPQTDVEFARDHGFDVELPDLAQSAFSDPQTGLPLPVAADYAGPHVDLPAAAFEDAELEAEPEEPLPALGQSEFSDPNTGMPIVFPTEPNEADLLPQESAFTDLSTGEPYEIHPSIASSVPTSEQIQSQADRFLAGRGLLDQGEAGDEDPEPEL